MFSFPPIRAQRISALQSDHRDTAVTVNLRFTNSSLTAEVVVYFFFHFRLRRKADLGCLKDSVNFSVFLLMKGDTVVLNVKLQIIKRRMLTERTQLAIKLRVSHY